ncbi:MAG: hypothetical protein V4649_19130 [Bacteroidota bacterium]
MRRLLLLLFLGLIGGNCLAQDVPILPPPPKPRMFAFYLSSPLGLLSKGRVKLEFYATRENSISASVCRYWGLFPGYQATLEYRHYFVPPHRHSENFIYAKGGYGDCEALVGGIFFPTNEQGPGQFAIAGGGVGRHFNFGRRRAFFIDAAAGLKGAFVSQSAGQLFYTLGPGSIVDLNFHFGWQF